MRRGIAGLCIAAALGNPFFFYEGTAAGVLRKNGKKKKNQWVLGPKYFLDRF